MNAISTNRKKYFSHPADKLFFIFGLLMLCSEIWKQLTLTFLVGHGVYNLWYFPFQLCSIPMYVFLALPFARPEKIRRALLCFIMCYALLGGTLAFADTSGLHYSYAPLTVHSYLWHFMMIGTAIFSGIVFFREQTQAASPLPFSRHPRLRLSLHAFAGAAGLYLACCLLAVGINLSLDKYGTINMFYINPDYPMQQIVFRDIAARTGNLPAILIYIFSTVFGAFLLCLIWNGIFYLFSSRKGQKRNLP